MSYLRHAGFKHDAHVTWVEGKTETNPGITYTGHIMASGLDGLTIQSLTGRIHTVKASELTEIPDPSKVHHQARAEIHSELTKDMGRHAEDHEVQSELDRRILARRATVPSGSVPSVRQNTWPLGS